jgi:hypothetical protein
MLLGSPMLEVGVGMAFFFLLLATLCTSINEIIARWLALRASTLQSGVGQLLSDPNLKGFAGTVFAHPLIASLEKKGRPSYVHGRTFAAAVVDTVKQNATTVAEVRAAIETSTTIPDDVKRQLRIITNDAGDSMDKLRVGVGTWFDDSMDRVSGWYKRKTQVVTFFVALFLTLLLNADALALANGMLQNPAAREVFIGQVGELEPDPATGLPPIDVDDVKVALDPVGFELGWSDIGTANPVGWFFSPGNWIWHVPGWLMTTFAVLLGAPFWFDVVSRVSKVRSGGNPPPPTSTALPSGA